MESLPAELEAPSFATQQQGEEIEQQLILPFRSFKDPSWMTKNIRDDKKVVTISHMDVQESAIPVTSTDGYEFLCSYSWKQANSPTIYVPGTPPKWTPPSLPKQLAKDRGMHWCDQHEHRVSRYQFEPIFQSLAIMNPNVQFDDVDIVVNRNTLQKLYAFVSLKRGKQFYVSLDIVGKTLFIGRRERYAKTKCPGYGRTFEKDFTTEDPDLPDAEGHHRVIKYDLGGLKMVIRIEADSYLDEENAGEPSSPDNPSASSTPAPQSNPPNEFFLNLLGAMAPANAAITHSNNQHTTVIPRGTLKPHNQTLELKSNNDKNSAREQVWFGRTPHLIFGKNKNGLVQATQAVHLQQEDLEAWAVKYQRSLRRLVWLLQEMRRVVMKKTDGAAVLVAVEKGAPLQVFEAKRSFGALPKEVVQRFWAEKFEK